MEGKPTIVVPLFDGVTTAVVAFCLFCAIYPHIVKNKTQFYAGFVSILLVIFLHSLANMFGWTWPGMQVFVAATTCLLQIVAIVTLFLSAGGITLKQFGGDMARAYEVIRRGEEEKTIIVPIHGDMPNKREDRAGAGAGVRGDDEEPVEHRIDLPDGAGWGRKPAAPPVTPPDAKIPLE